MAEAKLLLAKKVTKFSFATRIIDSRHFRDHTCMSAQKVDDMVSWPRTVATPPVLRQFCAFWAWDITGFIKGSQVADKAIHVGVETFPRRRTYLKPFKKGSAVTMPRFFSFGGGNWPVYVPSFRSRCV
jgi:hypothetical protein